MTAKAKPLALGPILPGATLGMMGGGQLGRMFTQAAHTMGYRVMVLDPAADSPAAQIADIHLQADYDDLAALQKMGETCAAVSTEFENVPAASLVALAQHCRVAPAADAVAIAQDRSHEKTWLHAHGFATAPFAIVRDAQEIDAAVTQIGLPALMKVARMGYDGKGQMRINTRDDAHAAFSHFDEQLCVFEGLVALECELSVVLARDDSGHCVPFPVAENRHVNGILDVSIVPATLAQTLAKRATALACDVASKLGYVGVMAVEFFVAQGELLINELAPRPHNSGHFTLDACVTDQFEQQVRALTGMPLGDSRLLSPVVMVNILGDRWRHGTPDWQTLFANPAAKLHLYGKSTARPGRKMGHFNVLHEDVRVAMAQALHIRDAL